MTLESLTSDVMAFVQANAAWAPVIVAILCFAESLAVISFFVPATVILVGIGALIGASGIGFWPVWIGGVIGAVLGDWLSYWVGFHFKSEARHVWPLSRYPHFVERATAFCDKWGVWGVFIGRFSGPLRAFVPLAAGIFAMPSVQFQAANIASALVWALLLLAPGAVGVRSLL
jgi:membrane protein DedA with SNARE-associated domain